MIDKNVFPSEEMKKLLDWCSFSKGFSLSKKEAVMLLELSFQRWSERNFFGKSGSWILKIVVPFSSFVKLIFFSFFFYCSDYYFCYLDSFFYGVGYYSYIAVIVVKVPFRNLTNYSSKWLASVCVNRFLSAVLAYAN